MSNQKIESVEVKDGNVRVTMTIPFNEIIEGSLDYDIRRQITSAVVSSVASDFIKEHGEEVKKDVLENVNWPEIVRSEIALKVIQEAARR